jgi:hypothetical protein
LHDKTDDYLNYIENIKIEINKLWKNILLKNY